MALPEALINSIDHTKGFDRDRFLAVHAQAASLVSVRLNPAKALQQDVPASSALSLLQDKVPWTSHGYYLSRRPSFTFDPLFHAGCYYVQEASSMFLETAIRQCCDIQSPLKVLDLCAAPGGKSTLMQSVISADSVLVSNEVIKSRAAILEENLTKWGGPNVIITNNDPKDFSRVEGWFDLMVVDAPCSGSGLFRRDPSATEEWSEQNVALCSQRQQRILADAWPTLREEGILIYSTCSYSQEEDEDVLDWICETLDAEPISLKIDPTWNIVESITPSYNSYGYRFWPDKLQGEGFFIGCFRKKKAVHAGYRPAKKSLFEKLSKAEETMVSRWLKTPLDLKLVKQSDSILAIPAFIESTMEILTNLKLYVRQAGIRIGKLAAKDLIPDHALAMSTIVEPSLVAVTLKYEQAIQYLRRDEVELMATPGWSLLQYQGINLGWAKVLSNRINNYYPKEWRILKKMDE